MLYARAEPCADCDIHCDGEEQRGEWKASRARSLRYALLPRGIKELCTSLGHYTGWAACGRPRRQGQLLSLRGQGETTRTC